MLFCIVTHLQTRIYVPKSFRSNIINNLHNISHSGIRASRQLTLFLAWYMHSFIKKSVEFFHNDQRSKTQRHNKNLMGTFSLSDARFAHIHIDFISSFPPFDGYTYYLRIIDRIITWTKVIPTTDVTAETACKALIHNWITRFGCPVTITTGRGKNFESHLCKHLTDMLGTNCIWATSYQPQSNGLVER